MLDFSFLYSQLSYQFGKGVGDAVLKLIDNLYVTRYKGGSPRAFFLNGKPFFNVNPKTGIITLSKEAATFLFPFVDKKCCRIIVNGKEYITHTKGGILAPIVKGITRDVRAGKEVFIVDEEDNLLAIGKALIGAHELIGLRRGEVAKIRRRIK